jgi:hypothetical protein
MRGVGTGWAIAAALLALAGCGEEDRPLPAACNQGAQPIVRALQAAPAQVLLAGTTTLSTCVERARSDADIQAVGAQLTAVADHLATRLGRSDPAALQLGYLIGAARRGSRHTSGIHEELVRRLEQTAGPDGPPPPRRSAFRRGEAAGERSG